MIMKKIALVISLCAVTLVLAGDASTEHVVNQQNKEFSVTEITIKPGDKIVFKNADEVTHNVFSNSKFNPFNIKVQQPGGSSTVELKDEGTTEVRCAIHPKMKLLVTVKK
jgi:plastocyanin